MISRSEIFEFVKDKYNTHVDYPFENDFDSAVLRHVNGKWYGLIMHVKNKSLHIEKEGITEIINLKIDPELNHFLKGQVGVLPALESKWMKLESIIPQTSMASLKSYGIMERPKAQDH